MSLKTSKTILMLGINGSGMRGLAYLLENQGKSIIGSDRALTKKVIGTTSIPGVAQLVLEEEVSKHLAAAEIVIHTDAIAPDAPLLEQARLQGKEILAYHQALGELAAQYEVIAVTGTHGKSSTTAFLAHILMEAGKDPSVLLGARMQGWSAGHAHSGQGKYLVVEADEYREHFLTLHPQHIIITSIDYDHPDYFDSLDDVTHAYNRFLQQQKEGGFVVTPQHLITRFPSLAWPASCVAVSDADADNIQAPLPGSHMQQNAALAVALAVRLGVDHLVAQHALQKFPGLGRRFESLGHLGRMEVISDYGHHPAEIAATIAAARQRHSEQRLLIIFEAHMFERLQSFYADFVSALQEADGVIIYPPFAPAGREQMGSLQLVKKLEQDLATYLPTYLLHRSDDLAALLKERENEYNVVLGFSAGVLDEHLRTLFSESEKAF